MKIKLEFLKEKVELIVFLELKKDLKMGTNIKIAMDIPIPILTETVKGKIYDSDPSFNQNELVEGIIFLMGLDSEFKYHEQYKDLLVKIDPNILEILANQLLKNINEESKVDSLIKLVGIYNLGLNEEMMLINIGRLAVEIFNSNEDSQYNQLSHRIFNNLIKNESVNALPYYYMGYYYYNKSQYSMANKYWEESMALELDEIHRLDLIEVFPKLKLRMIYEDGYEMILKGRYDEGLEKLLSIKDEFSQWWNLFFFIGLGYRFKEEYSRAIHYFERALELNSSQVDIFNEIGICYTMMNENKEAIDIFVKALVIEPKNSEILCNIGISYYNIGNIEMANKFIEQSFELNPDDEITLQWLKHLNYPHLT